MKVNQFNNGLNLRHDSSLLAIGEGVTVNNVDLSSGSLVPINDKTLVTGQPIARYLKYFEAINTWQYSAIETSYVEYRNKLYIARYDEQNPTSIIVNDGTGESGVGLDAPDLTEVAEQVPAELVTNGEAPFANTTGWTVDFGTLSVSSQSLLQIYAPTQDPSFYARFHQAIAVVAGVEYKVILDWSKSGPSMLLDVYDATQHYIYRDSVESTDIFDIDITPTTSSITCKPGVSSSISTAATLSIRSVSTKVKYVPEIAFTYYNSVTGIESTPTFNTSSYNQATNVISWIFDTVAPTEATELRIYHRGYATGIFSLIAEVATNAVSYQMPATAAIPIDGKILDSYSNTESPTNLRYLSVAYARLFAAKDTKLYFSEIADFGYWPTNNFLEFDDTITGIAIVYSGLIVMTQFRVYLVTGTSSTTFTITQISGTVGCVSHYSIAYLDGSAIWLANEGLVVSNGGKIENFAYSKLGDMKAFRVGDSFAPSFAVTYRNKYYLAFTNTDSYGTNAILCVDKVDGLSFSVFTSYGESLALSEGGLYSVLGVELFKAFNGTAKSLEYKSGALTEGAMTMVKMYNSVYVSYSGAITIEFFINQVSVLSKALSHTGRTTEEINLPVAKQRGYELAYKVTGTGSLFELEYKVKGRDNGK